MNITYYTTTKHERSVGAITSTNDYYEINANNLIYQPFSKLLPQYWSVCPYTVPDSVPNLIRVYEKMFKLPVWNVRRFTCCQTCLLPPIAHTKREITMSSLNNGINHLPKIKMIKEGLNLEIETMNAHGNVCNLCHVPIGNVIDIILCIHIRCMFNVCVYCFNTSCNFSLQWKIILWKISEHNILILFFKVISIHFNKYLSYFLALATKTTFI